jgi:hypothetical protein
MQSAAQMVMPCNCTSKRLYIAAFYTPAAAAAAVNVALAAVLQASWLDAVSSIDSHARQLHLKARLQDGSIAEAGQAVQFSGQQLVVAAAASAGAGFAAGGLPVQLLRALAARRLMGLLQCMWETETGRMMAQVGSALVVMLYNSVIAICKPVLCQITGIHQQISLPGIKHIPASSILPSCRAKKPTSFCYRIEFKRHSSLRVQVRVSAYLCKGGAHCTLHTALLLCQVRLLLHGSDTMLGDAAAESELFATNCFVEVSLQGLCGPSAEVFRLQRGFSAELRLRQQQEDEELAAYNAAAVQAGVHVILYDICCGAVCDGVALVLLGGK